MRFILAIAVIAATALLGSRITFQKRRLSLGVSNILLTGTEYIFLGMVLGRMGLNFLDQRTLGQLEPALLFGLGWIGFLFGLQFEVKRLRELPRFYFSITAVEAVVTFVVVTIPLYLLLGTIGPDSRLLVFAASASLGSAACCTAQSALAIVGRTNKFENKGLLDLLRYISSVDGLFGLALFALAIVILQGGTPTGFVWTVSAQWFLSSVAVGVVPALILIALSRHRFSQGEFLLFLIGTVMFCAGLARTIGHSPLVAGVVCGVLVANFSPHRTLALTTVLTGEKSIYVILLLLVGAGWHLRLDYSLLLVPVYFLIRLAGKLGGAFAGTRIFKPRYEVPPQVGLGLVSEGGLAIAIIVSFRLVSESTIVDSMTTIIVFSVLVSELVGPRFILRLFGEGK